MLKLFQAKMFNKKFFLRFQKCPTIKQLKTANIYLKNFSKYISIFSKRYNSTYLNAKQSRKGIKENFFTITIFFEKRNINKLSRGACKCCISILMGTRNTKCMPLLSRFASENYTCFPYQPVLYKAVIFSFIRVKNKRKEIVHISITAWGQKYCA